MFNKLNIVRVALNNIPKMLRTNFRVKYIKAALKPSKLLHADFIDFINTTMYRASYNGGRICLEKALNDKFDPVNNAITVTLAFLDEQPIWSKDELKQGIPVFSRWEAKVYAADRLVLHGIQVYMSNDATISTDVPGVSSKWQVNNLWTNYIVYTRENYESALAFYVNMPSGLTYDVDEVRALVDSFILAGPGYLVRQL